MKTGLKTLLVAGLLANAALSAQAQAAAPTTPMEYASSHHLQEGRMGHASGMHRRMDPAKREAMVAKRLDELKAQLKITNAQEGSWTTFTAAMKPPSRPNMTHPDKAEMDKLTTPERIDKMRAMRTQHMADRQANRDKRENAVKALYADLNAEQKKTFDTAHSKMMHRWGDRKGKGHGSRHEAPSTPAKS